MATLDSGFEENLRAALLDDVEDKLERRIGPALIDLARENWEAYASRNGYEISHVWEDVEGPIVERSGNSVNLRIEWPGLTALFEFGVSPHTISGSPLLHFYWDEKDMWVKTQSVNWGSETGGIPESRAIRDAMNTLRTLLQA